MTVMIMMLVALCVLAVLIRMLFAHAESESSPFAGLAGILLSICGGIGLLAYVSMGWSWLASEHKASIINREYGTDYTREEVFFAADVIDTVRELDRKRIEINGDIFTGKERAK